MVCILSIYKQLEPFLQSFFAGEDMRVGGLITTLSNRKMVLVNQAVRVALDL